MPSPAFHGGRSPGERRPGYSRDAKRRRKFVERALRTDGLCVAPDEWRAVCAVCKQLMTLPLSDWWADHVTPVAGGGSERGPLRLSCKQCQIAQGSQVANAHNPKAVPRRRPEERHPGDLT